MPTGTPKLLTQAQLEQVFEYYRGRTRKERCDRDDLTARVDGLEKFDRDNSQRLLALEASCTNFSKRLDGLEDESRRALVKTVVQDAALQRIAKLEESVVDHIDQTDTGFARSSRRATEHDTRLRQNRALTENSVGELESTLLERIDQLVLHNSAQMEKLYNLTIDFKQHKHEVPSYNLTNGPKVSFTSEDCGG